MSTTPLDSAFFPRSTIPHTHVTNAGMSLGGSRTRSASSTLDALAPEGKDPAPGLRFSGSAPKHHLLAEPAARTHVQGEAAPRRARARSRSAVTHYLGPVGPAPVPSNSELASTARTHAAIKGVIVFIVAGVTLVAATSAFGNTLTPTKSHWAFAVASLGCVGLTLATSMGDGEVTLVGGKRTLGVSLCAAIALIALAVAAVVHANALSFARGKSLGQKASWVFLAAMAALFGVASTSQDAKVIDAPHLPSAGRLVMGLVAAALVVTSPLIKGYMGEDVVAVIFAAVFAGLSSSLVKTQP